MPKQKRAGGNAAGWQDVRQGGLAPFVNWQKKGQMVEGVVGNHRKYKYKGKTHTAMEVIDTKTGETVALTDNYALAPLIAESKKGDQVRVVFANRIKLKGRQTLLEFSKIQRKAAS
jgi:hypothetical protein